MTSHQNIELPSTNVLKQLPGIYMYMDAKNHLRDCNVRAAFLLGYDHVDESYGVHISDIPCRASECTDMFVMQNKQIIEKCLPLKILDIHPYRNDHITTMLTNKIPYYDLNGNVSGVILNSIEITHDILFNVAMVLADADKQYKKNNNMSQRSYMISDKFEKTNLTPREIECLFYFVRGMTSKKIANILYLSKRTVETHLVHIKNKLGCKNKADLIEYAVESRFIDFIPKEIYSKLNISVII